METRFINILDDGNTYGELKGSCVAILVGEQFDQFDLGVSLEDINPEVFDLSSPAELRRLADRLEKK